MNHIRRFLVTEEGPTAIEYAVMLALIIVVCVSSIRMLGCTTAAAFWRANAVLRN